MNTITVTGHRRVDADAYARALFTHRSPAGAVFNIGMALGWDMACAQACLELGIPYVAYLPFKGQELRWPTHERMRYKMLVEAAQRVVVVSPIAHKLAYAERNKAMVDHCETVWALWDGSAGGTSHCVHYALDRGVPVWNHWDSFLSWSTGE